MSHFNRSEWTKSYCPADMRALAASVSPGPTPARARKEFIVPRHWRRHYQRSSILSYLITTTNFLVFYILKAFKGLCNKKSMVKIQDVIRWVKKWLCVYCLLGWYCFFLEKFFEVQEVYLVLQFVFCFSKEMKYFYCFSWFNDCQMKIICFFLFLYCFHKLFC